ncbi:expressed unknown protein [Seminavis robusta]|uniref:Uncharacterized protein n=1 Tax=Seminavis robusta TaxID=568900 RepID=A0A9N8DZR9_9STRA|nr:expressed unknown protein [Seminavis robusta]|eukprot:Sro407_g136640.1 n/a (121) ;mRNA; r:29029-29536
MSTCPSGQKSFVCPDCGTEIPGTNCAHALSRAYGWRDKKGCVYMCRCKYPVRAKELRQHVYRGRIDNNRSASGNAFVYCETNGGGGHVYYGTFNKCVKGNGLAASGMTSVSVFERYSSAS